MRESKPGQDYANDGLDGYIPHVWADPGDLFNHVQLAANWDAIDAHLGRHEKGLPFLGDLKLWYKIGSATPDPGWVVCDGTTVAPGSHDFGTTENRVGGIGVAAGGTLHLPDFRGQTFMGANISHAVGAVAVAGAPPAVGAADAGNTTPGPGGKQGGNANILVPDHHHRHSHTHLLNEGNASSDDTGDAMQDDAHHDYFINTDASGTGHNVALLNHTHHFLSQYISDAHKPSHINARVKDLSGPQQSDAALSQKQTSTQIATTSGTDEVPLPSTGPGNDDSGKLLMDARPASIGVVVLMYVKTAT